jgi:hypothetical protein
MPLWTTDTMHYVGVTFSRGGAYLVLHKQSAHGGTLVGGGRRSVADVGRNLITPHVPMCEAPRAAVPSRYLLGGGGHLMAPNRVGKGVEERVRAAVPSRCLHPHRQAARYLHPHRQAAASICLQGG